MSVELVEAAMLSTMPLPERPLTVWILPLRSSVPLTATLPLPVPEGSVSLAPSCSVPLLISVAPV